MECDVFINLVKTILFELMNVIAYVRTKLNELLLQKGKITTEISKIFNEGIKLHSKDLLELKKFIGDQQITSEIIAILLENFIYFFNSENKNPIYIKYSELNYNIFLKFNELHLNNISINSQILENFIYLLLKSIYILLFDNTSLDILDNNYKLICFKIQSKQRFKRFCF
jgi:hypothetical protein